MTAESNERKHIRARGAAEARALSSDDGVVRLATPKGRTLPLPQAASVMSGRLVGRNDAGEYLVTYSASPAAGVPAKTTVNVGIEDIGQDVTLVFLDGDPTKPVISGLLSPALPHEGGRAATRRVSVSIDGERLVLSARREIVLQCGKSSLVLSRDGKVEVRGADLLSRSSGGNRIKGSTVSMN